MKYTIGLILSGLLLVPCAIFSVLSGFKEDCHHEFHLWYGKNFYE